MRFIDELEVAVRPTMLDATWDKHPALHVITRGRTGIRMSKARIGDWIWDLPDAHERPPAMLPVIALAIREFGAIPLGITPTTDDLVGVAFEYEAWGLAYRTAKDAEAGTSFTRSGGLIVDHPDRIEFRQVIAVDVDGGRHCISRQRGGEIEAAGYTNISGAVVRGLDEILAALKDVVPEGAVS